MRIHKSLSRSFKVLLALCFLFGVTGFTFLPAPLRDTSAGIHYAPLLAADIYEPDDTPGQAKPLSAGVSQTHSISPATDVDWVKIRLLSTAAITLETSGATLSDTRMWLYDSNLLLIEFDDDSGVGAYSFIDRVCGVDELTAGTYFIAIDEFGNNDEIPAYTIRFNITQYCVNTRVEKLTPVRGVIDEPKPVTFTWKSYSGSVQRYEICVDKRNNNLCDNGWVRVGLNTNYTRGNFDPGKTYYWQVRAITTSGSKVNYDFGEWWYFTIAKTALFENPFLALLAE